MSPRRQFEPSQAREIAEAFNAAGVDYLFIGKGAAILLGFPAVTQDVDIFPERSPENGRRIVTALRAIGFEMNSELESQIVQGKDFIHIKTGPFDVDLVFAPDGIPGFADAKARALRVGQFRVANLRDIIASKRASARDKDLHDLPYLERFRDEFEKQHPTPLKSATELTDRKPEAKP